MRCGNVTGGCDEGLWSFINPEAGAHLSGSNDISDDMGNTPGGFSVSGLGCSSLKLV